MSDSLCILEVTEVSGAWDQVEGEAKSEITQGFTTYLQGSGLYHKGNEKPLKDF